MRGMSRAGGVALSGIDHLRQSITDILTTRIGTRVLIRDYGSELPALVDHPFNAATKADMIAATATALALWEPRLKVETIAIVSVEAGRVEIDLTGVYLPDGKTIALPGVIVE